MSRRQILLLGAVLALALGLLAVFLPGRLSSYREEIKLGPSPEARRNPYLAAETFLRQRGLQVRRADSPSEVERLPSAGQTLLLLADRRDMTPRQAERLLDWTAKGGHLLLIAERLWDEDAGQSGDLLLDRLGIQQYLAEDLDDEGDAEPAEGAEEDRYPQLTKLYLENETAPAYLDFDTRFHLHDAGNRAHAWANSGRATHMLQLYHGEGLVTVLSDPWLWQNRNIADYDHAWLLWYLTQDSSVTLLHRAERDSLPRLLARHFPEALAALALLLILALWAAGQRRGPLLAPLDRARRQLEEHLRGSADFLLRHGGQAALIQTLQRDIQRRARRRHPGFERLDVASQWQVLGRLTRLPTSTIGQAMRPLPAQRLPAAEFTRQVAHLQTLRNAL